MSKGWECPKCEGVMSPHHPTCFYCKPVNPIPKIELPDGNAIKKCDHDWDYSKLLTSNPPKILCKKCNEIQLWKPNPDIILANKEG